LCFALRRRPIQFQLLVARQANDVFPVPFHQLAELFLSHHDQCRMLQILASALKTAGIGSFPHTQLTRPHAHRRLGLIHQPVARMLAVLTLAAKTLPRQFNPAIHAKRAAEFTTLFFLGLAR
jgi:hypothetical protein